VGGHTTLKKCQHVVEGYKKKIRFTSKEKKSSPRNLLQRMTKDGFQDKMKNNPKLSAVKLAAETEYHLHKKVNPEIVRRVLRQNDFHGRVGRKWSFISHKNQKVQMEFAENH
jgi:hypothetical protein